MYSRKDVCPSTTIIFIVLLFVFDWMCCCYYVIFRINISLSYFYVIVILLHNHWFLLRRIFVMYSVAEYLGLKVSQITMKCGCARYDVILTHFKRTLFLHYAPSIWMHSKCCTIIMLRHQYGTRLVVVTRWRVAKSTLTLHCGSLFFVHIYIFQNNCKYNKY